MSNLNKWNTWYSNLEHMEAYGHTDSYKIGADFLNDCQVIEDWGCGKGWFRTTVSKDKTYIGLDGSHNKFVDKHVDLEEYKSSVDGIFMRHVLEHNYGWQKVLSNALKSFTNKMVLIFFTPWSEEETKQIGYTNSVGVPDLSFSKKEIESYLTPFKYEYLELNSPETFYGIEYMYLISR